MIYILEDFLNDIECNYLIKLFDANSQKVVKYRNTLVLNTELVLEKKLKNIIQKVNSKVENLHQDNCILDNSEIVLWPEESYQNPHYDPDGDLYACIIYLNDSYDGGQTCFLETFKVNPERGKCLIFSNSKYLHWVEKIKNGNRYTLSLWYINKSNE
jgi:hypothetical protein